MAITLIVVFVVGSVAYSAYQDYTTFRSELSGTTGKIIHPQGSSEIISLNMTVPNNGFYPLNVTVTCDTQNPNIVCQPAQVYVPPGQQQVLHFRMTVVNVAQFFASSNHRVNGTVSIRLEPLASISIGVDLGGFVRDLGGG